jgi:hypothetical protein
MLIPLAAAPKTTGFIFYKATVVLARGSVTQVESALGPREKEPHGLAWKNAERSLLTSPAGYSTRRNPYIPPPRLAGGTMPFMRKYTTNWP